MKANEDEERNVSVSISEKTRVKNPMPIFLNMLQ